MHFSPRHCTAHGLAHRLPTKNIVRGRPRWRGRCLAVVLAAATAAPGHAWASAAAPPEDGALPTVTDEPEAPDGETPRDDDQLARAMDAFTRGSESYNKADYQAALSAFLEAATLYASPDFQYNIGLCYEKLEKPEEAIAAFETYLKTKKDVPDRANVEDRIRRLRTMAEQARTGGSKTDPDEQPKPTAAPPPAHRPFLIAGAVLTAVGGATALGGGLGLGLAAKGKSDDLEAALDPNTDDPLTFDEAATLEDDGKRLELGQIVVVAIGGAIGLTGVALLAVGLSRRAKARRPAPAAAARMQLSPAWSRGGAGLSLSGRF